MPCTRPDHPSRAALARRLVTSIAFLGVLGGAHVREASAQEEGDADRLALTTDSEAARQHFWAGVVDALNVHPAGAATHFEMALEADPDLGLAIVMHGFTAPGLTGAQRTARIDEGIAALATASSGELLTGLAFKEWGAGNAPAASRLFEVAATEMPGDPYLASWATQLAGARGDQTDAITRLEALVESFPELANPHNTIAYQQYARGNEAAAFESVRRYVELAPDHPNAADSHAELLQWSGRFPEAFAEHQRATELDPDYSQAYAGVAEILVVVGAGDGAREWLGRAIEHAPAPGARVNFMRAVAATYMIDRDGDGAIGQLEQASSEAAAAGLDGANALAREQMALADAMLGDGRFVAEYLEEAATIRGDAIPLHHALAGLAYAVSNQPDLARQAAGALDGSGAFMEDIAHSIDAMVLLSEGDAAGALAALDGSDPSNPIVQIVMSEAYTALERPGAAAALRRRVLDNRQINLANPFWAFAFARAQTD